MTFRILTILFLFLISIACQNQTKSSNKISAFCAASLATVLEQIKTDWEREHTDRVIINSASSGTLARQIEYGAQADIFLSANHDWMAYALDATANFNKPQIIARNTLVLISGAEAGIDSIDFQSSIKMLHEDSGKIALGDPGHVPLGKYTRQTLEFYGIFDSIQNRVILAKDARSTLRLVELGEAAFGLVYLTDAIPSDKVKIIAIAPGTSHDQIEYEGVLINESNQAAKQFLAYLSSGRANAIWVRNGFNQ